MVVWSDGFRGVGRRLNAEKNEEGYLMIEFRPEGYIDRLCSDITLNRRDMRSKLGYIMLYSIVGQLLFKGISALTFWNRNIY